MKRKLPHRFAIASDGHRDRRRIFSVIFIFPGRRHPGRFQLFWLFIRVRVQTLCHSCRLNIFAIHNLQYFIVGNQKNRLRDVRTAMAIEKEIPEAGSKIEVTSSSVMYIPDSTLNLFIKSVLSYSAYSYSFNNKVDDLFFKISRHRTICLNLMRELV